MHVSNSTTFFNLGRGGGQRGGRGGQRGGGGFGGRGGQRGGRGGAPRGIYHLHHLDPPYIPYSNSSLSLSLIQVVVDFQLNHQVKRSLLIKTFPLFLVHQSRWSIPFTLIIVSF